MAAWDKKDKGQKQRAAEKLRDTDEKKPITYENLRASALRADFLAMAESCPGVMFALPQRVLGDVQSAEAEAGVVPLLHSVDARLALTD